MQKVTSKLVMVAVAVMLAANVSMALTIPAHAIAKYRTWLTNSYTYLAERTPYFPRSYGTVPGMPMFMLESIPAAVGGGALLDTVMFSRPIACPFVVCNADTGTMTVMVFRDYGNNTPLGMASPSISADSGWFAFAGEAQGFVLGMDATDTTVAHYYLIGGYALPVPNRFPW